MDSLVVKLLKYLRLYENILFKEPNTYYPNTKIIGVANNQILLSNTIIIDTVTASSEFKISFTPYDKIPEIIEELSRTNPEIMDYYVDIMKCDFGKLPFDIVMLLVDKHIWIGDKEVYDNYKI